MSITPEFPYQEKGVSAECSHWASDYCGKVERGMANIPRDLKATDVHQKLTKLPANPEGEEKRKAWKAPIGVYGLFVTQRFVRRNEVNHSLHLHEILSEKESKITFDDRAPQDFVSALLKTSQKASQCHLQ